MFVHTRPACHKYMFCTTASQALKDDNTYPMQINLRGNDIGDAGAKSLAKVLQQASMQF